MSQRTGICVSLTESTVDGMLAAMRKAPPEVDLFELRLDYLQELDLARLLSGRTRPVIVTNRPVRQGGRWAGSEQLRIWFLRQAVQLGADYVDAEDDSVAELGPKGSSRLIISHHDLDRTPQDLRPLYRRLAGLGADIVKVVTTARSIEDTLAVFRMLGSARMPAIGLAMGEAGVITRILAPRYGAFLTFASLERGKESAPGQLTVQDLVHMYRFRAIGPRTALYGVIARPVAHSLSPLVHNTAFAQNSLDAVYLPLLVDDVKRFIDVFSEFGFEGFSVTIPHKESALRCASEVEPVAAAIGAVNTLVRRSGGWFGANTDWIAVVRSLEEALAPEKLAGKRFLLVGAGGAARAMAFGLRQRGCDILIANRTYERGVVLAQSVGGAAIHLEDVSKAEADILLNATSVGMYPNTEVSPVPREALRPGMVVFDSVYNPLDSLLLRQAREAGCRVVSGLEMFILQAAEQFRLWTGREAPVALMRDVVLQALRART